MGSGLTANKNACEADRCTGCAPVIGRMTKMQQTDLRTVMPCHGKGRNRRLCSVCSKSRTSQFQLIWFIAHKVSIELLHCHHCNEMMYDSRSKVAMNVPTQDNTKPAQNGNPLVAYTLHLSFHLIHGIAQPLHARDTNIANWFVVPPPDKSLLTAAVHRIQSRAAV